MECTIYSFPVQLSPASAIDSAAPENQSEEGLHDVITFKDECFFHQTSTISFSTRKYAFFCV